MGLSDYVAVSISLASAAPTAPAFNTLLILGANGAFTGTRSYSSITAVGADFASTTQEYKAAEAAFGQTPAPQSLKIAKASAIVAGALNFAFTPVVANPTAAPVPTTQTTGGTVAAGTYECLYTWTTATGETLPSPAEAAVTTTGTTSTITVPIPAFPTYATGANIYISAAGGTAASATKQGSVAVSAGSFTLTAPPTVGTAQPTTNNVTFTTNNSIVLTVNGVAQTAVNCATSVSATMMALASAIAAATGVASAAVDGANANQIDVTGDAGYDLTVSAAITGGLYQAASTSTVTSTSNALADDLAALVLLDNQWYWLCLTTDLNSLINIESAAPWVETQEKQLVVQSSDANILTNSAADAASVLGAKNYKRTDLIYHASANAQEYPDVAWVAFVSQYAAGSTIFGFAQLAGVTADALTSGQIAFAKGKNCNVYIPVAGLDITDPGVSVGGQYMDITLGLDFVYSQLQADIFALFANATKTGKKIPYTDPGAAQVASVIRRDLKTAIKQGILADDGSLTITVPKVASQPSADRAARYFPDITFSANLQGAIQKVQILGTVAV